MGIQDIIGKLGGQQGAMQQVQRLFGSDSMQGVTSKLTSAGLGQQVQSWIGKGDNKPVSGDQIRQGMDPAALQQFSQQAGMKPEEVCDHVAQALPHLINQGTPEGKLPSDSATGANKGPDVKGMAAKGIDAMKGMFNR
jgi:uncharacterized protein YidB (DUF937 family)